MTSRRSELQQLLRGAGIEVLLGRDAKLHTSVKLRVIGRAQQLVRVDFEDPPDHEVLSNMLADFARVVASYDAVLFSDYGKGGLAHIPRMIGWARAAGKAVLVDPKGSDYSRYAGATRAHAQSRRARAGDRRLEQRGAAGASGRRRCAQRLNGRQPGADAQ